MDTIEEKILRDMLNDLVDAKGKAKLIIKENIVEFMKKVVAKHAEAS